MDNKFREKFIEALTIDTFNTRLQRVEALIEEEIGRVFLLCASIARSAPTSLTGFLDITPLRARITAGIQAAHLAWIHDSPVIPEVDMQGFEDMMLLKFRIALRVCVEQRGDASFIDEYLPGGVSFADTIARFEKVR